MEEFNNDFQEQYDILLEEEEQNKKKKAFIIALVCLIIVFLSALGSTYSYIKTYIKTSSSNLNIDTDGDGIPDFNIDFDGDGVCDVNCDTNNDGRVDINIDYMGNRKAIFNLDTDGDGKADTNLINVDINGDGICDINCDRNNDGRPETNIDFDGDGKAEINIDTNNDGKPDINIDTNGDGLPDLNIDTDGDLKPDVNVDTNGDGKCDINCIANLENLYSGGCQDKIANVTPSYNKKSTLFVSYQKGIDVKVIPGWSETQCFVIKNETDRNIRFNVNWIDVINDFAIDKSFTYTLKRNGTTIGTYNIPKTNSKLLDGVLIPSNTTYTYEVKYDYHNLPESQDIDQGKTFHFGLEAEIAGQKK